MGIWNGNYYHVDLTLDWMIFCRPLPELGNYKTPIEGLYLTGAGTHPGGSISGMPGHNTAGVFIEAQQAIAQNLADAANSLESTAKSEFRGN